MESFANVSNLYQVAEIELIYKPNIPASQRPKINCAKDAYNILIQSWNAGRLEFIEEFKILLLNNANQVIGIFEVSKGGIAAASVDIRLVFAAALKANATAIILAHNHPSGHLKASQADKCITENIKRAGEILDIRVLDHLIMFDELSGHILTIRRFCDLTAKSDSDEVLLHDLKIIFDKLKLDFSAVKEIKYFENPFISRNWKIHNLGRNNCFSHLNLCLLQLKVMVYEYMLTQTPNNRDTKRKLENARRDFDDSFTNSYYVD